MSAPAPASAAPGAGDAPAVAEAVAVPADPSDDKDATMAEAVPVVDAPPAAAPAPAAGAGAPARVEDDEEPVPLTSWPASCPSEEEEHVVSVVCGNSHLHWAFHHGIRSEVNPALFWRTPPLNTEDLSGSIPEALSRHLPQFAHDYIFGNGNDATAAAALAQSQKRQAPKISVYMISTNSDQVSLIAKLWRSIPCRMYLMRGDDFFSAEEGRYDTMGVDRLATLRGAAEIHGFPALVFDGGTATTYTAADADGRIMGGGIGPGLHVKFRSLNDYTDALPHISPDDVLKAVRDAVHSRRPLPTFGSNTKEAIMVDVLSELAVKGRNVIQKWLDQVGDRPSPGEEVKTSDGRRGSRLGVGLLKSNDERNVLVTGGDGEILTQLFQPDQTRIVELGPSYRPLEGRRYTIMHAKHLVHYGISAAIVRQVDKRKRAKRRQKRADALERSEKFVGQRVAKRFDQRNKVTGDNVYRGAVKGIEKVGGEEVFLVVYEDGDKESVDIEQLEEMIELYSEVGEAAPPKKPEAAPQAKMPVPAEPASSAKGKKRKADEVAAATTPRGRKAAAAAAKGDDKGEDPRKHVGSRVAKDFDGEIYYGKITVYDSDADTEGGLWHVVYDDGDEEDYEKKDLRKALKLYEKHRGKDPKKKRK